MTTSVPSIADHLKNDTRAAHAALEKEMLRHLRAISSPSGYAHFLQRLLAFLCPLQARLDDVFDSLLLPDIATRRRPNWMEDDLSHLPQSASLPPATHLPTITDTASAFGVLYVLEGSTLGGSVIAGLLQKGTGDANLPLRYFRAYGDQNRERWQVFRAALSAFAESASDAGRARIIAAADDTFTAYRRWLESAPVDAE